MRSVIVLMLPESADPEKVAKALREAVSPAPSEAPKPLWPRLSPRELRLMAFPMPSYISWPYPDTVRDYLTPKPAPKNGDRLDSLTVAGLDALPVGAAFVTGDSLDGVLVKRPNGEWSFGERTYAACQVVQMADGIVLNGARTLVLPETKRTPKGGDRLDSFTVEELDALPVGAKFICDGFPLTKTVGGRWTDGFDAWSSLTVREHRAGSRTLVLPLPAPKPVPDVVPDAYGAWIRGLTKALTPKPAGFPAAHISVTVAEFDRMLDEFGRTGKVTRPVKIPEPPPLAYGTRLAATTDADLDALPVGSRFEDWSPVLGLPHAPIVKTSAGWRFDVPNAAPMSPAWWRREFGGHRFARRGWVHTPKPGHDGDRLGDFAVSDLDALPEGSMFGGPYSVARKHEGRWYALGPELGDSRRWYALGPELGDSRWLLCNVSPTRTLTLPRSAK